MWWFSKAGPSLINFALSIVKDGPAYFICSNLFHRNALDPKSFWFHARLDFNRTILYTIIPGRDTTRASHTSHLSLSCFFFIFSSQSLDNNPPPRAWQWSTVSHSVCFLALNIVFFFLVGIFFHFDLLRIKPWSFLGFNHYIKWPHPKHMTSSARKQTLFLMFTY